ncbi:hypothetical protein SAMN05216345_13214, partial [Cupriavidus sp. YR651]
GTESTPKGTPGATYVYGRDQGSPLTVSTRPRPVSVLCLSGCGLPWRQRQQPMRPSVKYLMSGGNWSWIQQVDATLDGSRQNWPEGRPLQLRLYECVPADPDGRQSGREASWLLRQNCIDKVGIIDIAVHCGEKRQKGGRPDAISEISIVGLAYGVFDSSQCRHKRERSDGRGFILLSRQLARSIQALEHGLLGAMLFRIGPVDLPRGRMARR